MKETWKDIEGYEGRYKVSNQGRVISLNYKRSGKPKVLTANPSGGYCCVSLRGKVVAVHRLVATAFVPNPENKKQVHHTNFDPHDNRASNLVWMTKEEHILTHGIARHKINI